MTNSKDQYLLDLWNRVLEYLMTNCNVSPVIIDNFYRNCSLYDVTNQKAIIEVPDIVSQQLINSEFPSIKSALSDILDITQPLELEACLSKDLEKYEKEQVTDDLTNDDILEFQSMPIQSDRTFDNFVVGDCNRESHAAALACAAKPGQFFNPLFIYGNSGLGKTHLLMSIANFVLKSDLTKKVYYTESLKFVETVVNAIRENKIEKFKKYMYGIDLLLIDDIQFLAGKEKSHEIFFTIYNELINNHKQVVIASDRQPNEIRGLEDRLISRFNQGLPVGMDSPEFETSLAILQVKIKQSGYGIDDVDPEGLAYIASNFSGNVRNLEGAWNRVLFYAIQFQPDGGVIRFETIMEALKSQAVVSEKTGLSPKKIIRAVADYYGLTHQQITSKTRTKNIANARHISIYLCRKLLDLQYNKIGDEFGGRDHSTIISSCLKIEKDIKTNSSMATAIKEIEKSLGV